MSTQNSNRDNWAEKNLDDFGEFCFETDHVALKCNADYQSLLRTLAILEGQRILVVQNTEKLYEIREEALKDPLKFVEKLQRGDDLGIPKPITAAAIPVISWKKYGVSVPSSLARNQEGEPSDNQFKIPDIQNNDSSCSSSLSSVAERDGRLLVRGRTFDQQKPETFNQLWTPEEQKRLEELLSVYPPERVEMERFRKIAKALGNRTPLQVQSRVQKYFIKLQKAGLPVPGRTYNFSQYSSHKKGGSHKHHRLNKSLYSSSSFFPSSNPPVLMNDADDAVPEASTSSTSLPEPVSFANNMESIEVSDEEGFPESVRESEDYQEFMWLKLLRKAKAKRNQANVLPHDGYQCDRCGKNPIAGVRWHCPICPAETSTDFCDSCLSHVASKTGHHQESHRLVPIIATEQIPNDITTYLQANFD